MKANLNRKPSRTLSLGLGLILTSIAQTVVAQQHTCPERMAELKATMEASNVILRQYQWIQTTVVSVKGEVKSRQQEQCYYGADGKVQKVTLFQSAPPARPRGLRGRIAEAEEKKIKQYMEDAISTVRQYVPPNQSLLQAAKDAGKMSIQVLDPNSRAQLTFADYHKPGDSLSLVVNLANNHPVSGSVTTYLDSDPDKNPVTLALTFSTLDDGTTYLYQGVWFIGSAATGPWAFCTSVPAAIYTIPPSNPHYNVTYVVVQGTTPTTVTYAATAGYSGEYVAATGVLMFGAGIALGAVIANNSDHYYYYPPPSHYSYGYGAVYHYGYGGYHGYATGYYGPYGGAHYSAGYNPATGTYARSESAYGPYGSASRGAAYNPYTGTSAAGRSVNTAYGSARQGAAYNPTTGNAAWGGSRSSAYGSASAVQTDRGGGAATWNTANSQGTVARSSSGQVYASNGSSVYRQNPNGSWSQNSGSGWNNAARQQQSSSWDQQRQSMDSQAQSRSWGNSQAQRTQSWQSRGGGSWGGGDRFGGGGWGGSRGGGFGGGGFRGRR